MMKIYKGDGLHQLKIVVEKDGVEIDLVDACLVKSMEYTFSANSIPQLTVVFEDIGSGAIHHLPWQESNGEAPTNGNYKKWKPDEVLKKAVGKG